MKHCQNINCQKNIARETAIYCPYCGQRQPITGWHFHQQPHYVSVGKFLSHDINFSRPVPLKINKKIDDCLADGNIFVIISDTTLTAYDVELSLNSENAEQKWTATIPDSAKVVIMRPYVVVCDKEQMRSFHLETGEEKKLLTFSDADEILPFKDSKSIISLEHFYTGFQHSVIICCTENALLLCLFNRYNSLVKYCVIQTSFDSPIIFMHRDSQNEELINIYSTRGETTQLNLNKCINGEYLQGCIGPVNLIFQDKNFLDAGAELEFAFSKRKIYYSLVRKMNGKTILYKTDEQQTYPVCKEPINKKAPSVGLNSPFLLFESEEFPNLLIGYQFSTHEFIKKSINIPSCFALDLNEFELHPSRLLYFSEKYWAICPCKNLITPFQLVALHFGQSNEITVKQVINIPFQCKENDLKKKSVLPLLLVNNKILTYFDNTLVIIK